MSKWVIIAKQKNQKWQLLTGTLHDYKEGADKLVEKTTPGKFLVIDASLIRETLLLLNG